MKRYTEMLEIADFQAEHGMAMFKKAVLIDPEDEAKGDLPLEEQDGPGQVVAGMMLSVVSMTNVGAELCARLDALNENMTALVEILRDRG